MEFDFSKVKVPIIITKDFILKNLDDSYIFTYYFGSFKLGRAYNSFFDKGDQKPSTMFYLASNGRITYLDFRTGEKLDCFSFVQKLFGYTFKEALERIAADFGLIDSNTIKVSKKVLEEASKLDKEEKGQCLIQFEPDIWTRENLKFWRRGEITEEELVKERVYPIKKLYLNHQEIFNSLGIDRYAYPEEYGDKQMGVKVYSPEDKQMKWLSSLPLQIPFGLNDLPYADNKIIIQKSKKDKLISQKFFTDVIATQNESEAALSDEVQTMIHRRYSHAIIIWDNDPTGVENCTKFNIKGFDYFNIPKIEYTKYGIKDCFDYVSHYGLEALEILFRGKGLIN